MEEWSIQQKVIPDADKGAIAEADFPQLLEISWEKPLDGTPAWIIPDIIQHSIQLAMLEENPVVEALRKKWAFSLSGKQLAVGAGATALESSDDIPQRLRKASSDI